MNFSSSYNSETKTWESSRTTRLFDENCSVGRIALYMLRSKPRDVICQISDSEDTKLTNGMACDYAIRMAQQLNGMQLTSDDIVGIVGTNTTYLMPLIAGCALNATPFHVINPIHEEHVITHMFDITKPKIIFCDGAQYDKIKQATSALNVPIYTLCDHIDNVPKIVDLLEPTGTEMFYQAEPLKYGPNQTVAILCSSGTTGLPKAVTISNAKLTVDFNLFNGSSVLLSFSTPDWGTGLMNIYANIMYGGTRIISAKPFTPAYLLELIAKYKVNTLTVSPMQIAQTIHSPHFSQETMKSIFMIFITGGHCPVANLERLRSVLPNAFVINSYGCSEFGGIAACITDYKSHTVGKLIPNVELRILDLQTRQPLGPNDVGEIWVRSRYKWLGYFGNEKATREIMDSDNWICTGDMGFMDDEQYLHLVDRSKDVMKYCSFHYSPHEIEETIETLPDVLDVCVFGVFDEEFGDLAAAAIVKRPGSTLTEADVIKYVAEKQTVKHKQLNYGVFFVPQIVRNSNGKLLRQKTKEMCLNMEKNNMNKSKI